jgi:carboxymethylenebutenolidase
MLRRRRERLVIGRSGTDVVLRGAEHGEGAQGIVGYRALPASGRGRGVLVLHDGAGLSEEVRDACDRLARGGFAAVAPDLMPQDTGPDPTEALPALDPAAERVLDAIDAAVYELLCNDATEGAQVGALGFGAGGVVALRAAMHNRRIGAVVDFYGADDLGAADTSALEVDVLAVVGDKDEIVSEDRMRSLAARLEAAGARVHVRVQPGVGHDFMNEARAEHFDAVAAAQGWDAALAYLRAEL